jgi:dTDP-4-dehydrorhamnose reductase
MNEERDHALSNAEPNAGQAPASLAPELILNSSAYTAVDQAEDERDLVING